jgi:hypothetical protein
VVVWLLRESHGTLVDLQKTLQELFANGSLLNCSDKRLWEHAEMTLGTIGVSPADFEQKFMDYCGWVQQTHEDGVPLSARTSLDTTIVALVATPLAIPKFNQHFARNMRERFAAATLHSLSVPTRRAMAQGSSAGIFRRWLLNLTKEYYAILPDNSRVEWRFPDNIPGQLPPGADVINFGRTVRLRDDMALRRRELQNLLDRNMYSRFALVHGSTGPPLLHRDALVALQALFNVLASHASVPAGELQYLQAVSSASSPLHILLMPTS